MTPTQEHFFNTIKKEMIAEYDGNLLLTPNEVSKILRCRQLLVSPQILNHGAPSGGIEVLVELTKDELSNDTPVAIFTPFRPAVDIILTKLRESIKDLHTFKVLGGMSDDELKENQQGFQAEPSKNKVIVSTIKSSASSTFTDAKVAIFLGYEWGADDNSQAEDRLCRIGQDRDVRCLYLLYKGTPDEQIIERLNDKQMSMDVSMPPAEYYKYLIDKSI
jgi:SNF2 family DNA or RNA helicase